MYVSRYFLGVGLFLNYPDQSNQAVRCWRVDRFLLINLEDAAACYFDQFIMVQYPVRSMEGSGRDEMITGLVRVRLRD